MTRAAVFFGTFLFAVGLVLFAYAGTYTRFWADDYCYSAQLKQFGLFPGLVDWYLHSGNRLTTLAVVAVSDLFGWAGIRVVPAVVLALWVAAWVFFLRRLARLLGRTLPAVWLVFLAVVLTFFAALLAPDRLQTVYWRMGTFHYSLPIPVLLVNLGLLASCFRYPCPHGVWLSLAAGFLGFFAAGLSETAAALQAGIFLTGMLAALVFARGPWRTHLARLFVAPLAGTLLMMTIMMLAPANSWRQAVMPPPDNLLLILPYSIRYAADFAWYTIRGQVTPFIVFWALLALAGWMLAQPEKNHLSWKTLLASAATSLLLMMTWIACSFAPSAFANLAYPAGRALMPACVLLLSGTGCAVFLIGTLARRAIPARGWGWTMAAVLMVLLSLYPLRAAALVRQDIVQLSVRAERWDARHGKILQSISAGNTDVRVEQVDVVQGLEDMGPDPTQWINVCATILYGAHSITAAP